MAASKKKVASSVSGNKSLRLKKPLPKKQLQNASPSRPFPVVGIGASAGGLDAFKRFLKAIPENSGMAYVLVQHLDPSHESVLPDLLAKTTKIPVIEITDNIEIASDHIYIIPPNKILTAKDSTLKIRPREFKNQKSAPIDVFFTSLAEVYQSMAVGVVLSGTASDGTLGLKAIKQNGGITFAQDSESAAYDSMPQSAIAADVVDFVLPPEKIPPQLLQINKTYQTSHADTEEDNIPKDDEDIFKQILALLRHRGGVDFTYYKKPTIRRRIARRMAIAKKERLGDYLTFLRSNKSEQDALFQDVLIPVTSFFRDAKSFQSLSELVFPALFKNRSANESIRIWVAGCSTGEEAYSIAICLHEFLAEHPDANRDRMQIQIFATDISEKAISKARQGIYSKHEVENVSEERLEYYFTKTDGAFHVRKFIREMCVFAVHNFLKDPPFARMDMISCRNVLIYMDNFLQKKALTTFHYSLKERGFLLMGNSESAGVVSELFERVSRQDRIFSRKTGTGRFMPVVSIQKEETLSKEKEKPTGNNIQTDYRKNVDDILLSKFTPPGVVVNEQSDIVHFHGVTDDFLVQTSGKPTLNVVKLARESLGFELRNGLHKARMSRTSVVKENIPVRNGSKKQLVTIEIIPLNTVEPHFLILFRATPAPQGIKSKVTVDKDAAQQHIEQLEKELEHTRNDMRAITEEQEASNEELQSANEELLSNTEELQSLNEELETSKEELQSGNEELVIMNQELIDRQQQINDARQYAEAIVSTIREPLIVLDSKLRVRSANRSFYDEFKLNTAEIQGRSLFEIGNRLWDDAELRIQLERILPKKTVLENFEIRRTPFYNERTMLMSARRIVSDGNEEPLILLAIEDITQRKLSEEKIKLFAEKLKQTNLQLEQYANIVSHDLQEPLRKIVTFISTLQETNKDNVSPEIKAYLNKIGDSASRLTRMIQDLLNYARISNLERLFKPVDLNIVLKNITKDFELLIKERKAEIKIIKTADYPSLPTLEAIPLQMNQLIYNLISNSLKFSKPDTAPVIQISTENLAQNEASKFDSLDPGLNYCEIIFQDNGIGFDEKYANQIFIIFQRLNKADEYAGTGIGLALCKKIVDSHHGEIFAESIKGKGTAIHVILPLRQTKDNPEKQD